MQDAKNNLEAYFDEYGHYEIRRFDLGVSASKTFYSTTQLPDVVDTDRIIEMRNAYLDVVKEFTTLERYAIKQESLDRARMGRIAAQEVVNALSDLFEV